MRHGQAKPNVTVMLGDKGEKRTEGTTYGEIHWTEQLFSEYLLSIRSTF